MSSQEKDPKSPATTSTAYDKMLPSWRKVQTVLDGTAAMRNAGATYLPQHEEESTVSYDERRDRCTLLNQTKLTLNSWVGRPFGKPIVFAEVPAQVEELFSNIDLVGNDISVFSRHWLADGIAKAYSHVLIDFPRTDPAPDGTTRTLADDQREGVRPYWVHIQPENLIYASAEMVEGVEVLREIRLLEKVVERVGFAEKTVDQIRRLTIEAGEEEVLVELYRKTGKLVGGEDEWIRFEAPSTMSIGVIPLVTFYADRSSFMEGISPLLDLADLNIAHWQSTSDQRAVLTVARFPILALSGAIDEDKVLTVGPNAWLWSPDPQGKFYYVEHTGAAIEAGRLDIAALEEQMASYGAQFLKKAPSGQTATSRLLDSAEASSPLQDIVRQFSFALNQAMDLTARWLKLDDGGEATLDTDFGSEQADQAKMTTLREARKARDISRLAYLLQLQNWKVLDDDFDAEVDQLQLEKEQMDLFGMPPELDDGDEEKEAEEE